MYNLEKNTKVIEEIRRIITEETYKEYKIEEIVEITQQLKLLEEDTKSVEENITIKRAISLLETELEKKKLYEGIYETKTATFNHDVYLYGVPNKTYGTYDGIVKITDEDGNTVYISYKDMCRFVDKVQAEIKENIYERDKLENPKAYERTDISPPNIAFEHPERAWSWPKHDDPAPDLAHCSEKTLERILLLWR